MEDFWDARAREDAFFFVDNRLDYRKPDVERFWEDGRRDLEALLGELDLRVVPGETVIDVGCGLGRLTRVLAEDGATVIALDVSAEMLDRARALNPHLDTVTWLHGDGTGLTGVADASADALVSHVVFQHIPDPLVTLGYVREMGRVLRPGGWAAFQISNDAEIHRSAPSRDRRQGTGEARASSEGQRRSGLARLGGRARGAPGGRVRSWARCRADRRRGNPVLLRAPAPHAVAPQLSSCSSRHSRGSLSVRQRCTFAPCRMRPSETWSKVTSTTSSGRSPTQARSRSLFQRDGSPVPRSPVS